MKVQSPNLFLLLLSRQADQRQKRSRGVEALKKEAKSAKHLLTHIPKNPYCEICKQAKMYKIPGYAGAGTTVVEAKEFGDHITADHVVLHRDSKNVIEEARLALVIKT